MKRRLIIIAICLLLGAVVNYAVAWWLTVRHWDGLVASERLGPEFVQLTCDGRRVWDRYMQDGTQPQSESQSSTWGSTLVSVRGKIDSAALTKWLAGSMPDSGYVQPIVTELRAGWPFRSTTGAQINSRFVGLLPVRGRRVWSTYLPLIPVWPGLIANVATYATVLWLLMYGLSALRRFLRVRRGLCPKCAYPIGESSVCTECGNQFRKHPVA